MRNLRPKSIYQDPPESPVKREDCYIYHSIDLPGESLTGDWDLRPVIDDYLGHVDFTGKSVLDVGTATGFLSFAAEQRHASSVTSLDIPADEPAIVVPWAENKDKPIQQDVSAHVARVQNGYWYCHKALSSRVRAVHRNVLSSGEELGQFDVVLVGCVLLHIRDFPGALTAIAARCSRTLIIADLDPGDTPGPVLLPNFPVTGRNPSDLFSWWQLPASVITRFLSVIGFDVVRVLRMSIPSPPIKQSAKFYSLVAERRG